MNNTEKLHRRPVSARSNGITWLCLALALAGCGKPATKSCEKNLVRAVLVQPMDNSLAGIMVSHIIVLSDFIEEARAKGLPLEEALVQAGLARLRPVLVTVLATVGGLIPLFLTGGALWHPLTAVHIVGLLLATVLTLVMLPTLYYVFCSKLKFIK